jgi:superfamily II DNA/RNA helicase
MQKDLKNYVNRIGYTGRLKHGRAVIFIMKSEEYGDKQFLTELIVMLLNNNKEVPVGLTLKN